MYLNEKDCQHYYCMQAGGGNSGSYFQGVRYQRGGGWFQQIYRSISPLMMKAGKYFGKKLLRAGSNVMSDVASGSSLKDAARTRFLETSKNIRDDLFQKAQQQQQHGKGIKKRARKQLTQLVFNRTGASSVRKKRKKKTSARTVSKRRKTSDINYRDIFSQKR